jgi:hypothetical protein
MLNKQMACANLAISTLSIQGATVRFDLRKAVVLSHIALELLSIGSLRRLPSRLLQRFVEVVWKVLGLRVTNFPTGWETCVSLPCCQQGS